MILLGTNNIPMHESIHLRQMAEVTRFQNVYLRGSISRFYLVLFGLYHLIEIGKYQRPTVG